VPTATESQLYHFRDWAFRFQAAQAEPSRLLIVMHGWMGDENSMWVLLRRLSSHYDILAPRGSYPVPEGGYSWREIRPNTWGNASLEALRPSTERLLEFVDEWSIFAGVNASQFDVMGFSQGAAMTITLALLHPERIRRLVVLSGFIPENGEFLLNSDRLSGKPVFLSHGRQDELIPVERARLTLNLLKKAGALVTYCESDAGHKVSKGCMLAMEKYLEEF
jgi:phospholipase/carboxylesterase